MKIKNFVTNRHALKIPMGMCDLEQWLNTLTFQYSKLQYASENNCKGLRKKLVETNLWKEVVWQVVALQMVVVVVVVVVALQMETTRRCHNCKASSPAQCPLGSLHCVDQSPWNHDNRTSTNPTMRYTIQWYSCSKLSLKYTTPPALQKPLYKVCRLFLTELSALQ